MPRQQIEHQNQVALIRWAEGKAKRYPQVGMLFAIANAGGYKGGYKSNVLRALWMKAEGVRPGVPDLFLPVPQWKKYKGGLFIEMKSKDGKVSKEQQWWIDELFCKGYEVVICRSWVEAALIICAYFGIPHTELDHAA